MDIFLLVCMKNTSLVFRSLLAIALFSMSFYSLAGDQIGKVKEVHVRGSDGLHFFFLEGVHNRRPACATSDYWMIKGEGSAAGKSQLSMLLAAQAQQKTVYVTGANTCTRWVDGEDVDDLSIK